MKRIWKWVIGIVLGLIVLTIFVGTPFLYRATDPIRNFEELERPVWHMHDYGMMHHSFMPYGSILMGLFPLAIFVLVVLGIVWLVNRLTVSAGTTRVCAHCAKSVQAEWKHCPYCGKKP